jgi:hypothetical protein
MDSPDSSTTKSKSKNWRSWFKSPAKANYDKVLAQAYEKKQSDSKDDKAIANMTDEEKAKAMVAHRDATSVTGTFMLGDYRPAGMSPGYEGYYEAGGKPIS